VTGAGSGVGQGIIKALRISGLPVRVVAADIAPMNAALFRADEAFLIPRVEHEGALERILDLLQQHRCDVVMIGSEFDLEFFSSHKATIESQTGAIVIVAPPESVAIANNKWLTAEFLRKAQQPSAEACLPKNCEDAVHIAEKWGFPIVLKTRRGTSSRHVHIVRDAKNLKKLFPETPSPMIQRAIDIPSHELRSEYTCSVFKTSDGMMIGPFTARRTVKRGTSWHIEVAPFEVLNAPLLSIANALEFAGSLNIQLMLTEAGAVPFELNCRFSGTTAVRAHFGFNEPEMALRSFFYKEAVPAPVIRAGVAMRYYEEVFIENVNAGNLSLPKRGVVNPWF